MEPGYTDRLFCRPAGLRPMPPHSWVPGFPRTVLTAGGAAIDPRWFAAAEEFKASCGPAAGYSNQLGLVSVGES